MIDNQQAGRNLMLLRLQKGLSQQGLAELCNVTHQAVSKWENGAALPDVQTLLFLSTYYGVSMEEILTGRISLDAEEEAALPAVPETPTPSPIPETPPVPPVPEEQPAPEAPSAPDAPAVPVLSWEQILDLAPFASRETLDRLAERCMEQADESHICDLAPFVSKACLDRMVRKLLHARRGLAFKLAPFLSRETLDWLILNGQADESGREEQEG